MKEFVRIKLGQIDKINCSSVCNKLIFLLWVFFNLLDKYYKSRVDKIITIRKNSKNNSFH